MSQDLLHHPVVLKPAYKDYIWGGKRISSHFNRKIEMSFCAESWESSDRDEGMSFIQSKAYPNLSLKAFLRQNPHFFAASPFQDLPLLTKIIDASENLSVQVHPSLSQALGKNEQPKTELWYILDADQDSKVYIGLKKNLSKKDLHEVLIRGELVEHLNEFQVKKGDFFYIPGGLIHAIGKGCLIYEVQQNSNTTYRLYDWGRKETAKRALHIEDGLRCILQNQVYQLEKKECHKENETEKVLSKNPFFSLNKYEVNTQLHLNPISVYRVLFCVEGSALIACEQHTISLDKGQSALIPAQRSVQIMHCEATATLLESIPNI